MEPFYFLTNHHRTADIKRGFTLIEMVVVLAIITILIAVILVGQTSFNRTLLLTDTAYTVALSIREAQSYGLSSLNSGSFANAGYGIHFSSGATTSYLQFADTNNNSFGSPAAAVVTNALSGWCPTGTTGTPDAKPGDCLYFLGLDQLVRTYNFNQGFTIGNFCAYDASGHQIGCSGGVSATLTSLDIVFQRPNTTTVMTVIDTNGNPTHAYTSCIDVLTPDGTGNRYVEVTQLGEVSVLAGSTCPDL